MLQGIARQALELFMAYASSRLQVRCFRAKILESNAPSIALFESMGFQEVKRVAVFKEVHLELRVEGEVAEKLAKAAEKLVYRQYDEAGGGTAQGGEGLGKA